MAAAKHILVFRFSAMGDVAMTIPVLRAFRQQYPHVKLTVVSNPFYKPFFNTVGGINFYGASLLKKHKGLLGIFILFANLTRIRFTAIADLHDSIRSMVIRILFKYLFFKKTAFLDKGREEKKALVREEDKVFKELKTMHERHADIFKKLGYPIDLTDISFPEKKLFTPTLRAFVGNHTNKQLLGIAPYAQYESKIYPQDLMQEVIRKMAQQKDIILFLFGSKSERQKLEVLKQDLPNVKIVPGAVSFEEEIILISHLDLLLSMDSGNGHIAAMMGTKVVTLWGATHPYAGFMPFNQPIEYALTADRTKYPLLPTSVYGNKEVPGYEDAMRTISPQSVIQKINKVLATKSHSVVEH